MLNEEVLEKTFVIMPTLEKTGRQECRPSTGLDFTRMRYVRETMWSGGTPAPGIAVSARSVAPPQDRSLRECATCTKPCGAGALLPPTYSGNAHDATLPLEFFSLLM